VKAVSDIDELNAGTIRTVYGFYRAEKRESGVSDFRMKLAEQINFHGGNTNLRKTV
jgi:hypothetical protein